MREDEEFISGMNNPEFQWNQDLCRCFCIYRNRSRSRIILNSAELFCTSVVAEAPGIAVASVDTGAPFNTGSPVVTYIF